MGSIGFTVQIMDGWSEMAFDVWCELVCDNCSVTTEGQHTYGIVPRQGMKKEALARGWALVGSNWYCRACKATPVNIALMSR